MSFRTTGILAAATLIASVRAASAEPAAVASAASPVSQPSLAEPGPSAAATTDSPGERTEETPSTASRASIAASDGAFLFFTPTPSTRSTFGVVNSGYDGARKVGLYQAFADAHVIGGLSVRAGYSSHDLSGEASASIGARFQLLNQDRHGLDLGVGLFYEPHDIDGEGLVKGSVALSRKLGHLALMGAVGYGQDPEGDDHRAELSLASLYAVVPAFYVGIDARARALVFSSDAKHNGVSEPVLDVAAGPLAQFLVGPVALSGQVGLSAVRFETHGAVQPASDTRYGFLGLLAAGLSL